MTCRMLYASCIAGICILRTVYSADYIVHIICCMHALCIAHLVTIIGGSCHKHDFCHDKMFVATKHVFCSDKSMLVATKRLSQQTYFCRNKTFVTTKIILVAAPANDM